MVATKRKNHFRITSAFGQRLGSHFPFRGKTHYVDANREHAQHSAVAHFACCCDYHMLKTIGAHTNKKVLKSRRSAPGQVAKSAASLIGTIFTEILARHQKLRRIHDTEHLPHAQKARSYSNRSGNFKSRQTPCQEISVMTYSEVEKKDTKIN